MFALVWFSASLVVSATEAAPKSVTFEAADGLVVTADLYKAHPDSAPMIVLFHQAGWSRGEYREIAPKLQALGFNCLAVDQRSGGEVNGVKNETAARAGKRKLKTRYIDAMPDLVAALGWARANHAKGKIVGWGSSYSSSLILRLAGEQPALMDAALAFAPGEYFARSGKSDHYVRDGAKKIRQPVFITSARSEKDRWWRIYESIPSASKVAYVPKTKGNHGSRALWVKFKDHDGYWNAVKAFLGALISDKS